jgi:hypothetical protein
MYYDFQEIKTSNGNHVGWFGKPTLEFLKKHSFIVPNGKNGYYVVEDKLRSMFVV